MITALLRCGRWTRGKRDKQYRVEGYAAVFDEETVLYEYDGIEYKGSHRQERVYGSGDARCRDEL